MDNILGWNVKSMAVAIAAIRIHLNASLTPPLHLNPMTLKTNISVIANGPTSFTKNDIAPQVPPINNKFKNTDSIDARLALTGKNEAHAIEKTTTAAVSKENVKRFTSKSPIFPSVSLFFKKTV